MPGTESTGWPLMSQRLSEADRYLLDRVRHGDPEGWSELVQRYQGRLLAFARSQSSAAADAEDLVQETFLAFLRGLPSYRGDASVETYLFRILRRRIVDARRQQRSGPEAPEDVESGRLRRLAADEPTASWHARAGEAHARSHEALAHALERLIGRLQEDRRFPELTALELLFYGQWPNQRVAEAVEWPERRVGVLKHRWLKQLRSDVETASGHRDGGEPDAPEDLLSEVWEARRLSCPKRSTIGQFLLGTLERPWADYVRFHLDRVGCRFCQANREDLDRDASAAADRLRRRVVESTAGFFRTG